METKDLRKLAEEIAYKYEITDGDGCGTDCVFIDDTINAMLSFHEQASKDMFEREFVEWAIINVAILGVKGKFQLIDGPELEFDSLDELYQYWITNIKDK